MGENAHFLGQKQGFQIFFLCFFDRIKDIGKRKTWVALIFKEHSYVVKCKRAQGDFLVAVFQQILFEIIYEFLLWRIEVRL